MVEDNLDAFIDDAEQPSMARSNKNSDKKAKKVGGPFLAAAVFCEGIMEDASKKISAFGIMDGTEFWLAHDAPPGFPSKEEPITFIQNILTVFRTGDAPGKHKLRFVMEQPSGKRTELQNQEIELSAPPQGGCNVRTQAQIRFFTPGVYWIDVYLDEKRFTRMPLNIAIQRLPAPSPSQPTAASKTKPGKKQSMGTQ
jgi:hypothetical protein